jgi:hypothetical protein
MSGHPIDAAGSTYLRIPIRTRLILKGADLTAAVREGLDEAGERP